jgi:TBCC domain-containing protein 1
MEALHAPNAFILVGRTLLRQQLQQHLRNQHTALRGYGDYLRRNLKSILELAQDPTSASEDPFMMTAKEVDRISFLFKPLQQRQGVV